MKYDFDKIVDRKNTNSLKYDFALERKKPQGLIPMWVADMDFQAPKEVLDALHSVVEHGIFGYSQTKSEYFDILHNWFLQHFDWDTHQEWLVKTAGIVNAICTAVRAFTKAGDAILIQQPVYYPFESSVKVNDRKLVVNQLVLTDGKYVIDFTDFEEKIRNNKVKLFILCSPHNPVGRVWTTEELMQMGNICKKYGVLVLSDEIHADFVYPANKHYVFAALNEFSDFTITCTAPTKTFNLAGLHISNIFIKNQELRRKFLQELEKNGFSQSNIMGFTACAAAYKYGGEWLEQLNTYLKCNLDYIEAFIQAKLPKISLIKPEGTYLAWLDFNKLDLNYNQLEDLIINKAGLWLDCGEMFGSGGEGFQRMNIACPRQTLHNALIKLEKAFNQIAKIY